MKSTETDVSTRRQFLARSGLALGGVALLPALQACGGDSSGNGKVSLDFEGWNYDPAFQTVVVNEFQKANPNVRVKFTAEPADQYVQKMIARFTSDNGPDLLYVRDEVLAAWADAQYIQPVQGMAGWDKLTTDLIPFDRAGMTYKGKLWGMPYYGDHIAYVYNKAILAKAGVKTPPTTWDEVAQQALAIQKAGILDTPVIFPLKVGGGLHWWSAIYASGGSLFDQNNDPVFPDKDPTALNILEWIVDAARNKKILDPNSVQMGTAETRLALAAGRVAFASSARYDLKMINDKSKSKVAGQGAQVLFPSLTADGPHGTVGWSQMFCISATTKHPEAAWQVIQYISSPQTAKKYYLKNGVGYAYTALNSDPDITAETGKWSDQALFTKQAGLAKARQALNATWYSDWDTFNMQQLQEAALGKKTARQALQDSADKARQLKKSA